MQVMAVFPHGVGASLPKIVLAEADLGRQFYGQNRAVLALTLGYAPGAQAAGSRVFLVSTYRTA